MSVMERRADAVNRTVEEIRRIAGTKDVTRATLAEVEAVLIELAGQSELFPPAQFPVTAGRGGNIYHLAEDADHSFALYASAGAAGKAQPPHNHTTWAVISGVHGDEHNVFYARTDNGATPGRGTLRKTGERTVRRGNAVAFLPDDFHTIEVHGGGPTLHLHMYGRSLERLPDRVYFDSPAGDTYKRFMAKPEIFASLVEARELKAMLTDGRELALLDMREEGVFSERHLLFASSLPLSRLELRLDALVPRRSTRIALCDDDDGLAQRAAAKLRAFGYRSIAVLAGGVAAWAAAGYELFSGVNVPSKAFGEFVEHHDDTPRLPAAEVKAKLDAGDDIV
ncbi:MAG: sulfurtransferase, partial [Proteobacteria bacterium]|nr:sulfurtransferase [Pseudomonadota bacterium]